MTALTFVSTLLLLAFTSKFTESHINLAKTCGTGGLSDRSHSLGSPSLRLSYTRASTRNAAFMASPA